MEKELEKSLRHIQTHPTTGTAHNAHVVSTQVETIFALDRLQEEIKKLTDITVKLDQQNRQLELSNFKLQRSMFAFNFITTAIATFGFLKITNISDLLSYIIPVTGIFGKIHVDIISIILAVIVSLMIQKIIESQSKKAVEKFKKELIKKIEAIPIFPI